MYHRLAGIAATRRAIGQDADAPIASADQALDVFDFERVARATLPPAHFGYLATGVDARRSRSIPQDSQTMACAYGA